MTLEDFEKEFRNILNETHNYDALRDEMDVEYAVTTAWLAFGRLNVKRIAKEESDKNRN